MQRREFISGVGAAAILSGNYQANAQASDANSNQPQPAASSSAAAAARIPRVQSPGINVERCSIGHWGQPERASPLSGWAAPILDSQP